MQDLRIRMTARKGKRGKYYFTTCEVPVLVDLGETVIHCFPNDEDDSAELVIRHYDQKDKKYKEKDEKDS